MAAYLSILSYASKLAFLVSFESNNILYFAHANEVRKTNHQTYKRIYP